MGEGEERKFGNKRSTLEPLQQCLVKHNEPQKQEIARLSTLSGQGDIRKWLQEIGDNPSRLRGSNMHNSGVPADR